MNKAELIDAIAKDAKLSKSDVKKALNAFISSVSGSLKKGKKVQLIGFGTWSVSKRAARIGRNPQTGATIKIESKTVAKFKPSPNIFDKDTDTQGAMRKKKRRGGGNG